MSRCRVLIADDHRIFAEGLRALLDPEFEVIGLVADGQQLVEVAVAEQPDVVVADVTMPTLNGIEAASRLHELGVSARVVILTMHRDVAYAHRAIAAGAAGYVLKHAAASELVVAVREAAEGRTYITPQIAGELLASYRQPACPDEPDRRLTARQREVLSLVAEGRSAKEVAARLGISVRTAEAHKANILAALGLTSTADLVRYALRHRIISV